MIKFLKKLFFLESNKKYVIVTDEIMHYSNIFQVFDSQCSKYGYVNYIDYFGKKHGPLVLLNNGKTYNFYIKWKPHSGFKNIKTWPIVSVLR